MDEIKELRKIKSVRYINRAAQASKGLIKMGLGTAAIVTPLPPVMAAGAVMIASGASDTQRAITGEYIKDSMVNVTKDDLIVQNLTSPSIVGSIMLSSDKKSMLMMQELNFLLQADRYKEVNGEKQRVNYHTRSQALTYKMLKTIQESGFIENLEREEVGKDRLISAKLLLGNLKLKTLLKKERMYNITFNITDKEITDKDILELYKESKVNIKSLDDKNLNVKRDKEGNVKSVNVKFFEVLKQKISSIMSRFKSKQKNEFKLLDAPQELNKKQPGLKDELENMVVGEEEQIINSTSIDSMDMNKDIIDKTNIEDDYTLR